MVLPPGHIYDTNRIGSRPALCASRVWVALLDSFIPQMPGGSGWIVKPSDTLRNRDHETPDSQELPKEEDTHPPPFTVIPDPSLHDVLRGGISRHRGYPRGNTIRHPIPSEVQRTKVDMLYFDTRRILLNSEVGDGEGGDLSWWLSESLGSF